MLIMFVVLCSCQRKEIILNTEESFYSEFEINSNQVLIYCTLLVKNTTQKECKVKFDANFDSDVEGGLLKEADLHGYLADLKSDTFKIVKGDNWINVVFVGEFGGKEQKRNRLLPAITMSVL